jgi:hypothetical protein
MRYATPGAFRTALERRLLTMAQQTGIPLVRLRKLVVFDRLLARLMVAAPNRWVVKGAVALHFRVGPEFRTTKDMDLGRQDSEEEATADFVAAQSLDLEDYFTFDIERTGKLDTMEGVATRYHVTAELAGRAFEDVTVDVGFGDALVGDPELVRGPELLRFAGIPPAQVPALPLEQHVADKVHAYTRSYAGGRPSTRPKDLIDLAMISSLFEFQAGRVGRALQAVFSARKTHPLPTSLPLPPSQWRLAYRRMAAEVGLDSDMSVGFERVNVFLDPILASAVPEHARWSPTLQTWRPPTGPHFDSKTDSKTGG